jgi:hypothetical protein
VNVKGEEMKIPEKALGVMAHKFGYKSIDAAMGINLAWLEMMGISVTRLGVLRQGKWHKVDFYINDQGGGEFLMDEFRIRRIPDAKKKKSKKQGRTSKRSSKQDRFTKCVLHTK